MWGVLHVGWYTHAQIVDYGVYQFYGDKVVHEHAVPYRDFELEYPPGALPVFVAPALVGGFDYPRVFQALMAACLAAAVFAAFLIAGTKASVLTAVAPLALGSVVLSRFDLWPAALTALALAAAVRQRWALSAMLIGTAFAAKLWPAVLVPIVAVWIARSEGGRAAGRWLAMAAGTAAAWFLPFIILSPRGVAHSFHVQFARPLQLESLGAAVLIARHHLTGARLFVETSYGSQNVIGPGAHTAAIVTSVVGVFALAAVYVAFARRSPDTDELLRYAAAAVAVTLAFGKVFSPQFLIWLIPSRRSSSRNCGSPSGTGPLRTSWRPRNRGSCLHATSRSLHSQSCSCGRAQSTTCSGKVVPASNRSSAYGLRSSDDSPRRISSARARPTAGDCMNPWPLKPQAA